MKKVTDAVTVIAILKRNEAAMGNSYELSLADHVHSFNIN